MRSVWLGACAAVLAAGCGGGQSSGGASVAGAAKTSQAGDAVVTYFGQPKPQIAISSGSVGVVAQAGATFSTVTLEPAPNLDATSLVFSRNVGGIPQLYKLPLSGSGAQSLYHSPYGADIPAASAYGTVAFNTLNPAQISSVRMDGTGLTQLNFGVSQALFPRYSTDGTNRISYSNGTSTLFIAPGTGGTSTVVQNGIVVHDWAPWSPSGKQLAYSAGTNDINNIYVTSTAGGTPTNVTPTPLQGVDSLYYPAWNADGITLAADMTDSSIDQIITFPAAANNSAYTTITPSGDCDLYPCWSPDGSELAFYRTNVNSSTSGIYLCDVNGLHQQIYLADPSNDVNSVTGLTWTPFLPKETVVAASGSTFYHQAASGFLLSQNGDQFGSLVAFTAATPSVAAIQAPTNSEEPAPMLFTLTADSITSIGYINSYFGTGTTIALTSTPSAVVSIDAGTGQVDVVAPASVAKPSSTKNADGTVTYTGAFKAVYDGSGKNQAPNGARQLVVNPKTGKLVSIS